MTLRLCPLASGSSGNAAYVATDRTSILVDCGTSAREVVQRLRSIEVEPASLHGILITHAHVDHYRAAGTLNARFGVPVYVDPSTARALARNGISTSWRRLRETRPIPDRIGDLEVLPMDTSHGSGAEDGRTVAYRFSDGRKRIAVVTDLGRVDEPIRSPLVGIDAILIEANHSESRIREKLEDRTFAGDWPYLQWVLSDRGHLSNRQCGEALAGILTGDPCHVFLGHLSVNHPDRSRDNNTQESALAEVRRVLVRAGVPVPHFHRTWRLGLEPAGVSRMVDL